MSIVRTTLTTIVAMVAWSVLTFGSGVALAYGPILQLETGGHISRVWDLAWTPDGRHLISAGDDKLIRIWNLEAGNTTRVIRGLIAPGVAGKIQSMALSPDGSTLAVGVYYPHESSDPKVVDLEGKMAGFLRLYDVASGRQTARLEGHRSSVLGLAFSPDGRLLVSGGGKRSRSNTRAIVWDVASATALHHLKGHKGEIYAVAFTRDGKRIVTASDDHSLMLWDADSGKRLRKMKGHNDAVRAVAVSARGDVIASGSKDQTIRLWDARTGDKLRELARQDAQVTALSFTPDGSKLVSSSGLGERTDVHVYSVANGQRLIRYAGHDGVGLSNVVSPDGRWVASTGGDLQQIDVWSIADGKRARQLAGKGSTVWAVGFSPDGSQLEWGRSRDVVDRNDRGPLEYAIRMPDNTRGLGVPRRISNAGGHLRAVTTLGDLTLATRAGGKYQYQSVLELSRGSRTVTRIERKATNGYTHTAYTLAPDSRVIVSGGANGWLTAYNHDGDVLNEFHGHTGTITGLAISPDGGLLASSSYDQTVRLWNLKTAELLITLFHANDSEWVVWTPTGHYAASPSGDRFVGWQLNRGLEHSADHISAHELRRQLYRPAFIDNVLRQRSVVAALSGKAPEAKFEVKVLNDQAIRPPSFEIISPADNTEVSEAEISVVLEIQANRNPVTDLYVFVNGRQVTTRSAASRKQVRVPLEAGENLVRIVAHNAVGQSEQQVRVSLEAQSRSASTERSSDRGRLILVAIGVDNYEFLDQDLRFAGNDASGLADVLNQQRGRVYDEVTTMLLTDSTRAPTQENILEALKLFEDTRPEDTVILFVAGHGVMHDDNYFFLPTGAKVQDGARLDESTAIQWQVFQDALARSAGRRILLVDTCHASNAFNPRLIKDAADQDIVVITSTDGETLAQEREQLKHGVFTYALLEGLKGRADSFRDGVVTITELHTYLTNRVESLTQMSQRPVLHVPGGFKNFVFSRL